MVMLQKWSLMEGEWSLCENSYVTEVDSNGGRMVMLHRWLV